MKKPLLVVLLIILTINVSAQWTESFSGLQTDARGLTHMSIASPDVIWGVAWDGRPNPVTVHEFTRSIDGGNTWTAGTIPGLKSTYNAASISAVSADSAWVAYYDSINGGGAIYRTTDGGQTWEHQKTAMFNGQFSYANFVHFWNAAEGIAVGDPTEGEEGYYYFEIYTTTDGGDTWARLPRKNIQEGTNMEMAMMGRYTVSGDVIWFPTTKGRVMRSADRGQHWELYNTPVTDQAVFVDMAFKDSLSGLAVARANADPYADDRGIYATTDGGRNWTRIAEGETGGIGMKNDVAYIPNTANAYIITGSEDAPYGSAYTEDGGLTWMNIDTVKHHKVYFYDYHTGFSGGFVSNGSGGVFKWYGNMITNIKPLAHQVKFNVYPNPSTGIIKVHSKGYWGAATIDVFDMTGRAVHSQALKESSSAIDLNKLKNGVYIAKITADGEASTVKLIIH